MYKINNEWIIYVGHWNHYKYIVERLHSEKELIEYLADGYHFIGLLDDSKNKKDNYCNSRYDYSYYDNYGRVINPNAYEYDAWKYFVGKGHKCIQKKNNKYHTPIRGKSIPYIHKVCGGPKVRPRKLKHIALMYDNPEYSEFNRGSRSDYPAGWWDDFHRHIEKNWKRQSKRRHQWKER